MSPVSNSSAQAVFDIFDQLNQVPRPSHKEGRIADWLCSFAEKNGLEYDRDAHNCVVIRKPASKGFEDREPLVILNHMDMVCVADEGVEYDPENTPIKAYVDDGWLKARGTSLGSDNGIGLSMALAILQDDSIAHPAIEVLTTTNEEDGMSGAANLDAGFIRGRKVLNLDSEEYDTITVGAAGAYLQIHEIPYTPVPAPDGWSFFNLKVSGGLGGHSGVDINKGRCNANKFIFTVLKAIKDSMSVVIGKVGGGEANASIAMGAAALFGVPQDKAPDMQKIASETVEDILSQYRLTDPGLSAELKPSAEPCPEVICRESCDKLIDAISMVPSGVVDPEGCGSDVTPMTSNNIGLVEMKDGVISVSTHTRSFSDVDMTALGERIKNAFGADTTLVMSAPAWRERKDSRYIAAVSDTFREVLGFEPTRVEMHFVLEAGYYVRKYPGIEIACIGPRIVCPHSTKERVDIATVENIWKVVLKILTCEV